MRHVLRNRAALALCLASAVVIPSPGHCRETTVGVKAGVGHFSYIGQNYRDVLQSGDLQNAFKLGFAAGGFATVYLTPIVGLQAEILVLGAGDACTGDASVWDDILWGPYYGQVKYIDRITYLALPALVKTRFGAINLFAGPTLLLKLTDGKWCLKAEDEWLQWDLEYTGLDSVEYSSDVFASFLFAATAGIGIEVPLSRRGRVFLVEARGQYVFTNVLGPSQGPDFNAYGIMLMVGYGIDSAGRKAIRSRVR